jgi:hypothetical protein
MFSLCITTLNRFDFLKKNIPKYLENELISEIIISDEASSDDFKLLQQHFPDNSKLKIFKNETVLGPFLNKIRCCKEASNEWIVLLDSDNFAGIDDYFKIAEKYIASSSHNINKKTILSPSMASPNFDYKFLANIILTKNNIRNYYSNPMFNCFINTGNYIINKNLIDTLNFEKDIELIQKSHACDVKLMHTLFLEQFENFNIHIVKNIKYNHVVHDESIYLKNFMKTQDTINKVRDRFYKSVF